MGQVIFSNDIQRTKAIEQNKHTLDCPRCWVNYKWNGDVLSVTHQDGCLNKPYDGRYTFDFRYWDFGYTAKPLVDDNPSIGA